MGWTGDDDPDAQITLKFPDLASAVAYAERESLSYHVRSAHQGQGEQSGDEVRLQAAIEETPSRLAEVKAALPKLDARVDSALWVYAAPSHRVKRHLESVTGRD